MAEINRNMSIFDRARLSLGKLLAPKAYQGAFEAARYSIHRTRVDAPPPDDFRRELNESARRELVRLSRWLEKNNGFYRQIIKDTSIYTVGEGIFLQALGGDSAWQSLCEAEWVSDCENPEVTNRFSMLECLYIICETIDRDGEIFVIKTKRNKQPKFQLVETHRIESDPKMVGTPNLNDGILFDDFGKPVFYFVKQANGSYSRIPAASMMHIYDPQHASMTRSYPTYQHAIVNLRDEMDLLAMEKIAAKDNSRVSRILRTADPTADIGDLGLGTPTNTIQANLSTDPNVLSRAIGGVTAVLNPNEELVEHTPARPTTAFNGFIEHLRRDSVMGGPPYEFIADSTKLGGTTARLAVAKAGRYFTRRQMVIISRFLRVYFQYWASVKIANGSLPDAVNYWKSDWQVTKPVTVDNGRDSANARADLQMGIRTPQDVFQENGTEFERSMVQKAKAIVIRDKVARQYNIDPERLLSLKSVAEIQGESQIKNTALQAEANGKIVDTGLDKQSNEAAIDQTGPVIDAPKDIESSPPAQENRIAVDIIPKQNMGLDRSREQPPIEYA